MPSPLQSPAIEGCVPFPFNTTFRFGESGSSEGMFRVADLPPSVIGVKVTIIVQLPPAGIVGERLVQGFVPPALTPNIALSIPVIPIGLVMIRFDPPVFDMVKV